MARALLLAVAHLWGSVKDLIDAVRRQYPLSPFQQRFGVCLLYSHPVGFNGLGAELAAEQAE
jgi:hypothetical protein